MSDDAKQTNEDVIAKAKSFRRKKAQAGMLWTGRDLATATPGWFPRLGVEWVRNADDPPLGYDTAAEAVEAARRYRLSCEEFVKTCGQ